MNENEELFKTAERLLPKYGGIAQFALFQATLLHEHFDPWTTNLVVDFEKWLEERK